MIAIERAQVRSTPGRVLPPWHWAVFDWFLLAAVIGLLWLTVFVVLFTPSHA